MAHMFQDYPPPPFFLLQKDMSLLLMLPGRDVCHVMEAQEVLGEWVVSLLRWHVLTAYADYHPHPNPILSPASYRFTTRQMAVIWEVLR